MLLMDILITPCVAHRLGGHCSADSLNEDIFYRVRAF